MNRLMVDNWKVADKFSKAVFQELADDARRLYQQQLIEYSLAHHIIHRDANANANTDADANAEVTSGMFTFVTEGTVNADSGFVLTTDGSITVGTTALAFAQFSGAGQITAGAAMSKTGNTLDVEVDNQTIEVSSDALRIKGITQTAAGDLIFGKTSGANAGYQRLALGAYDSTNSVGQMLQVGANNTVAWTNTIDGGTFS